jgi:hypothetical protein
MGLKSGMGSLEGLPGLADAQRARLADAGATTLVELAGMLDTDPDALRKYLGLSAEELSDLQARVNVALTEDTRATLDAARERHPLGALKPPDS